MSITDLERAAHVSLGYKSLQNDFFYVGTDTVSTYGIESKYLRPLFMLRDMATDRFVQRAKPKLWLLHCLEDERDLRGTGAYRYIQTMAGRAAARKKQAGAQQTIREVLEAQGGVRWYAPKATPHRHRIWLRKAFNGTYAPFVFKKPVLVDQRCNAIAPAKGVPHESLAAVITSTLFAYSLEINGSASLGAGALEAPTRALRSYPVYDVRDLSPREHAELRRLVNDVWENEEPVDWLDAKAAPGQYLRRLDEWFLRKAERSMSVHVIYRDLAEVCRLRVSVARDKTRVTKKSQSESISRVAMSVAESVRGLLELRRFPEDFMEVQDSDALSLMIAEGHLRQIDIYRLMDMAELRLAGDDGNVIYEDSIPWSVGEVIVRACLLGRREFTVSSSERVAERALREFHDWFREIDARLKTAIADSSLGTGYEEKLTREVYRLLGLHPVVGESVLSRLINMSEA